MKIRVPPVMGRVVGGALASLLARSWRIQVVHEEHWRGLRDSGESYLFVLWHEALLPLLWRHRKQEIAIVVSEARTELVRSIVAGDEIEIRYVGGTQRRQESRPAGIRYRAAG